MDVATPLDSAATPPAMSHRDRMIVLGAVLLGLFLAALDQTIVGTALPRIVTDLHGNQLYTWVVSAYLLSSTITVPFYGKLSDLYGRKLLLLIGVGIFLAGSALSGLSQSMTELIVFRTLQGAGAGALFPVSLAVIGDLFSPRERGRYQGLFGAVFGLSSIIGPFLGGVITDSVGWHWIFYVNVPIGFVAIAVIAVVLPNIRSPGASAADLDYAGAALFVAGVVPLLIGLTNKGLTDATGALNGWTSPAVGGLVLVAAILLTGFIAVEGRARQPIIPLDLFRDRTYAATNAATLMVAVGMFVGVIFIPRYYQYAQGVSATGSGYRMWPLLGGLIGSSMLSGILISRLGRYKRVLVVGMLLVITGTVLMTALNGSTTTWQLWLSMLILGVGTGPALSGFTVVIQNAAPRDRLGVATSTLTFLRQIGGTLGLAIGGTVFSQTFNAHLGPSLTTARVPGPAANEVLRLSGGAKSELTSVGDLSTSLAHLLPGVPRDVTPGVIAALHDAFAVATGAAFWPGVATAAVAFGATVTLRDGRLREYSPASPGAADEIAPHGAGPASFPAGEPDRLWMAVRTRFEAELARRLSAGGPRATPDRLDALLVLAARPGGLTVEEFARTNGLPLVNAIQVVDDLLWQGLVWTEPDTGGTAHLFASRRGLGAAAAYRDARHLSALAILRLEPMVLIAGRQTPSDDELAGRDRYTIEGQRGGAGAAR